MNLILFILGCAGAALIIIEGSIFESVRNYLSELLPEPFHLFFRDYALVGLYCGLIMGSFLLGHTFSVLLGSALAGSCVADFSANLLNYLQVNSVTNVLKDK